MFNFNASLLYFNIPNQLLIKMPQRENFKKNCRDLWSIDYGQIKINEYEVKMNTGHQKLYCILSTVQSNCMNA